MATNYQLTITIVGVDQTAPAQQGMERLGAGSVAAGNIMASALQAAAGAVVGLASSSLTAAADFQNATATFASVAGGALQEAGFTLEDVKNKALEMGAVTQFSAAEAQEAMINLAKGGVPIKDVMGDATQATLDLAAAGEVQLANAADIVAKQLGVWADTGVTAAQVANTLAQAANASTVDVEELALGLANVGGVAKVSGVSFQDLNQTMAMIAPGFSSAADAGTSLKTFLLGLQPSTGPAIEAFSKLGLMQFDTAKAMKALRAEGIEPLGTDTQTLVTQIAQLGAASGLTGTKLSDFVHSFDTSVFYDQTGAFVGMGQAADILKGALAGMSEAEQSAALKAMFGTDAFRAAALIAQQGSTGFDAMGASMEAAGTAAEQAAIRNATFKFAWDSLLGTLETLQIVIGSALLPVLTDLVNNAIIPAANSVLTFAQGILSAQDPMAALIAAITPFAPYLTAIGSMIVAVIVPAFYAWAAAAIAATLPMLPIIAIVAAIGVAVGLLTAAWINNWGGIQEKTAAAWAYIQPALEQLIAWLSVAIPAAVQAAAQFWSSTLWPALQVVGNFIVGTVIPILVQVASWLATNIPIAIQAAVLGFQMLVAGAQSLWTSLTTAWNNIVVTTTTTWAAVTGAVQSAITTVSNIITSIVTTIQATWNSIVAVTSSVWNSIVAAVTAGATAIANEINARLAIATTIVQAIWNTIVFLTQAAWNAILGVISPIVAQILAVVGPPIQQVVDTWLWGWETLKSVTASVWAVIASTVSAAVGAVVSVAQSAASTLASVWASISSAAASAWAAIVSAVSSAAASIGAVLSSAWAQIQSAAASAWAAIVSAIQMAIGTIISVITGTISTIQSVWNAGMQGAQQSTSAAWAAVQTIITGAMLAVKTVITAGIAVVQTIMRTAWAVVVAAAQNDFGKIPAIVQAGWDKVKAIFNTAVGMLRSIAGVMAGAAMELGKNIVSGIISGVGSMANSLKEKLKSLASSALDAAKSALGIHSPSQVFANMVGKPIPEGIAAGIVAATPKATQATIELGTKIVDLIAKGVDAFGKLRDMGSISFGSIQSFAQTLQDTMALFGRMTTLWNRAMISAAGQFTGKSEKIVEFIAKGAEAFVKLQEFQGIPSSVIHMFALNLQQMVSELIKISTWQMRLTMGAAVEFASGAGKALEIIGKGVEGLNKLGDLADPVPGSFQKFALQVVVLVTRMAEAASWIAADAVASAGRFAEGAGKVLAIVASGVDGFLKLNTLADPVPGIFQKFATEVFAITLRMAEVSSWISKDAVERASAFAEGAGKVIGIIGSGVDGFAKLRDFTGVAAAPIQAFASAVAGMVSMFGLIAHFIAADVVAAAATFAEGAGKVVGIIGTGVDGFTKLQDFGPISTTAMDYFQNAVANIVSRMTQLSGWFDAEGVKAAGIFSEGAGKVLGAIKGGVDGLLALKDLGPVSQVGLDAFAAAIQQLMSRLTAIAVQFSVESVEAAGKFSEAAGKAVGILKDGIDGLLKVNLFTGVSVEAMDRFGEGVRLAVAKMAALASMFGTDATAAAMAFAKAAGEATDFLKKGVDGFNKLGELEGVTQAAMDKFAGGVVLMINTIIHLSTVLSTDVLNQANNFANAIDTVIKVVLSGLKALGDLGAQASGTDDFVRTLVANVNALSGILAQQVKAPSEDIGRNIAIGIANGLSSGIPFIQQAAIYAVNAAIQATKAALGIASPSKVFEQQIGAQMSAGMAEGVLGGTGQVQAAVSQVSSGALTAGPGSTTNNNQRNVTVIFEAGAFGGGGGGNIYAQADAVVNEINRRLGMVGA